jgi:hypothetical protein
MTFVALERAAPFFEIAALPIHRSVYGHHQRRDPTIRAAVSPTKVEPSLSPGAPFV